MSHDTPRPGRDAAYRTGETALLFVDMQRIWAEPMMDPKHPLPADAPFMRRLAETVVPNQVRLLAAFRDAGENVLHTIIESLTEDGRDRSLDHKLSDMHVPKGAPEGAIIAPLAPRTNEIVLPKTSSGLFNSTNADYVLRNLGTRFLVIAGIVTDQCVDMAVRDAADRGYMVTLVHDACATYSEDRHRAALNAFGGYCWITDTETVLARIAALKGVAADV
ncbi:isochorismatase family cysteine hydrolase [Acidimangrovimonas pyrenivorans]|uniref:Isochorismatase family cysteine hydrolase n=1 Tax=Acidimangrovimonas pyrenivorans TaxID=2030798 RepID=A0ABV7AGN7_9RHOB